MAPTRGGTPVIVFFALCILVGFAAGIVTTLSVQAGYDRDEQAIAEWQRARRAAEKATRW